MAKEMMIVFVYDTQCCTSEEDDPIDAVVYFHPGWVSDTQRHALAGQVVGAAHCIKSLFSPPVAITLQSGKFIMREYGRYILAIGSDRNIPDWVLKNRASLLTSMIKVYHGDLQCIATSLDDPKRLAEKLYQVFETYLPVLQYGAHIFQRVPMLTLPKSATSVYMEAMQMLDQCRKCKGVLGGVMLYNNKIIATQLPPSLSSYLAVTDPYRIKSPAETLEPETPLPLGAQLLVVYVGKRHYDSLKREADRLHEFYNDGEQMIAQFRKSQEAEREKLREFPQSGMKRDKSLLFTAVPEEDHNMISPPSREQPSNEGRKQSMPDVVPFTNKPRQRPNKLSLSFKNQKSLDEDIKENDTVFTGQTSVCSTPMVEYKRLHGNILSICQNPDSQSQERNEKLIEEPDVLKNIENNTKINLENEKRDNKIVLDMNCIADHYINKPEPMRKLASIADIQDTFKKFSSRATSKFKLKRSQTPDDLTPDEEIHKPSTMTINDPYFPVFRNDGVAISESLYNQYLEQHYNKMKQEKEDNTFTFNMKLCEIDTFKDFDSDLMKSPQRTPKKKNLITKDSTKTIQTDQSRRKSLSLPLKSLSESSDSQLGSDSEAISFKKKLTGVQLTPLMEKLSHLAFSDKSSGYSSRVMTPLELREFTPVTERQVTFNDRPKTTRQDSAESDSDSEDLDLLPSYSSHSVKCALFVSGLQNMALLELIELDAANNVQTINSLWETSLALGPISQKCMEPLSAGTEPTDYSYLTLDPSWGTVRKGGPWAAIDIASMGLIHHYLQTDPQLDQMILRSEESVVLGVSCGGAQVYYQESGPRAAGPPGPSDALAAAPLRARRRLHRDHAVLLL